MNRVSLFFSGILLTIVLLVTAEAVAAQSIASLGTLFGIGVNPLARMAVIVVIGALIALLYPVVVTRGLRRRRAEKLTRSLLSDYAALSEVFDWEELEDTIIDCFMYVHSVCDKGNPVEAAKWTTERYRREE